MSWLRQQINKTWFRHPLSLRLDYGSAERGWFSKSMWGLPQFYSDWDPGWHASNRKFLGFMMNTGSKIRWLGVTDTN